MASANSATICSAQTSYKKKPGTLVLTKRALQWTPQGGPSPELTVANDRMSALFASKEGGPRVMLKVAFTPTAPSTDDSYNFTFTSAASALSDRERFKGEISAMIAQNREREAQAATSGAAAAVTGGVAANGSANGGNNSASGGAGGGGQGGGGVEAKGKGKERASDSPAPGRGTPTVGTTTAPSQASTFRLRKLVLQASPQLLALHRELVLTNQITEAEFWEGREDLLDAVAAEEGLMKGKSGEMVDPKTVTGQNGEVTVKITPALIREIFEEFPVVLRAYNDNVPDPLDEAAFWTRYFQSKLFNRNRTTNRAAVSAIKDDAIFDKYLGQEDDDIEPQHRPDHEIYRLLDLAATEEDQHEITNQPRDFTMKAGGQRASLPLMRRFNEHSERLLSQALGPASDRPRTYVDPGNAGDRRYYSEIELSDLTEARPPDRISLTLADRTNTSTLTGASIAEAEEDDVREGEDSLTALSRKKVQEQEVRDRIVDDWEGRLSDFRVDSKSVRAGMRDMMTNIGQQNERARKTGGSSGLPRAHLLSVESISTTSLEFLRHFWSAILPPKPNDTSAFALAPPRERAARAEKFKGYLEKSRARVSKAVGDAKGESDELGKRVEAALQPILDAIDAAVQMYRSRIG
ncbi:hypothetical protein JCM10212_005150 [Sporobolomyces blumeae]